MNNSEIEVLKNELKSVPNETKRLFIELGEVIKSDTTIDDMIEQIIKHPLKDIFDIYWPETVRVCSHCGKLMRKGYIWYDKYYCSDECLNSEVSEKEIQEERSLGDDNDDCFYTEWS